jgi:chromosome segregation ATPase
LRAALDKKGAELRGWAKTVRNFQPKYQQAIKERNIFEEERNKMFKEKERIQKALDVSQAKANKLSEEKLELESKLQELASSGSPNTTVAARQVLDLAATREHAAALEKQLAFLKKDVEYARSRYQDASDKAASLGEDNTTLRSRVAELETKASDNVVKLREKSIDAVRADHWRMYMEEKAQRQSAERELDRKNDELRSYKSRFGGRETRGSSVPRSPRVRQMSSRNTSPVGDNGNGGNGSGPGPISGVFGPRSTHLKENF